MVGNIRVLCIIAFPLGFAAASISLGTGGAIKSPKKGCGQNPHPFFGDFIIFLNP
jgi:hypothetical protein